MRTERARYLLSTEQRRLAAIMYTDMVGYTALAQRNESLSIALVEEQRKIIRPSLLRHNGREVKTIGDAFLVEFPSTLNAVRCAYDIQRAVREFNFSAPAEENKIHLRIGVHLGDVVEGAQRDISGDAVNVASRIESLAEDGGVCITRQVYDQIQNKFELPIASIGPKVLKNVASPQEVYRIIMPWKPESSGSVELDGSRVAVLPFQNMSPDPNDEYFADGMTEELISAISAVSGLRVVSRTSIMSYKDSRKQLSDIARELGVGSIVEGSVRKSKNRVRITVQLLNAKTDEHLWSSNYDRELDDIFAIQSEVSEQVAKALRVKLEDSERRRIRKEKTTNIDAYQNYLLGKHLLTILSPKEIKTSISLFESAVAADPAFAEAYVGIARAYESLVHQGLIPMQDGYGKSRAMAVKALEIDSELSEAYAILGYLFLVYDWNLPGSREKFEKSIALNPSNALSHRNYARCLAAEGSLAEAVVHAETSVQLDPIDPYGYNEKAMMYYLNGREAEAFDCWVRASELFPNNSGLHFHRLLFYIARGEIEKSRFEFSHISKSYLAEPHGKFLQGLIFAVEGKKNEAAKIARELRELVLKGHSVEDLVATIYATLGERDEFFRLAREAVKLRHWELFVLKNHDKFFSKELNEDTRWTTLLEEAGFS